MWITSFFQTEKTLLVILLATIRSFPHFPQFFFCKTGYYQKINTYTQIANTLLTTRKGQTALKLQRKNGLTS